MMCADPLPNLVYGFFMALKNNNNYAFFFFTFFFKSLSFVQTPDSKQMAIMFLFLFFIIIIILLIALVTFTGRIGPLQVYNLGGISLYQDMQA